MTAKFSLFKGSDSQYYFNLSASNGEVIGHSEGYAAKASALNGIRSVRDNSPYGSRYSIFQDARGQTRFHLKAVNGEIILQSEGYVSRQGALRGIESVKRSAPVAKLIDHTLEAAHAK